MQLTGLHHVTAITAHASQNLAFYTRTLGMRLVKKTVNQDDVSAYHLFYADAQGSPGTDLTFFDWPRADPNRHGSGTIAEVALRVAGHAALEWWAKRFTHLGVDHTGILEVGGQARIGFDDPEGQALALVDDQNAPGGGTPWENSPVPPEFAIRGLHSVTLLVQDLKPTAWLLETVLGFRRAAEYPLNGSPGERVTVFETGPGGPGSQVRVAARPDLAPGFAGRGGVHHVAFRTPDDAQQRSWRDQLEAAELGVTPVIDRFYFKSIYFREPGGVLFEIATDGPGFTADEDPQHLGEQLALPPFLEPYRRRIEAGLHPLEMN